MKLSPKKFCSDFYYFLLIFCRKQFSSGPEICYLLVRFFSVLNKQETDSRLNFLRRKNTTCRDLVSTYTTSVALKWTRDFLKTTFLVNLRIQLAVKWLHTLQRAGILPPLDKIKLFTSLRWAAEVDSPFKSERLATALDAVEKHSKSIIRWEGKSISGNGV